MFGLVPSATSYTVDFGDGQTCGPTLASCNAQTNGGIPNTKNWFPHTYASGTFTAKFTITDGSAQATATTAVVVTTLSGTWLAGNGSDGCTGRRTLQLTQVGTSLTGTYTSPSGSTDAASGSVGGTRIVNAILPSVRDVGVTVPAPGLVFFGQNMLGEGVSDDASGMVMQITAGDSSCGQPVLSFRRQ